MAEVYVVTRGDYSDYHICAVSLDKGKAEKLAKVYSTRYDKAQVETWEVDTVADVNALNGRRQYYVWIRADGTVSTHLNNYDYNDFTEDVFSDVNNSLRFGVYAVDEAAAIKIAAEKRAMYLAEKEGIS